MVINRCVLAFFIKIAISLAALNHLKVGSYVVWFLDLIKGGFLDSCYISYFGFNHYSLFFTLLSLRNFNFSVATSRISWCTKECWMILRSTILQRIVNIRKMSQWYHNWIVLKRTDKHKLLCQKHVPEPRVSNFGHSKNVKAGCFGLERERVNLPDHEKSCYINQESHLRFTQALPGL